MGVFVVDAERLVPKESNDKKKDFEVTKLVEAQNAFERMGDSDAPYRGKKMFGEGAHKANAYLFVEYGSFPPPAPRPYGQVRVPSDEELRSLIHTGIPEARQHEVEKIASSKSAFDRNFEGQPLHGFFKITPSAEVSPSVLSTKRVQRGLLDGVLQKSDELLLKRNAAHTVAPIVDPEPIPGFKGVGVGQKSRLERIPPAEKKETMPPMQPHFGTHHDLKYGVHGFTTCPPAPPREERSGWFNWVEDRQKCPVTDAGFDPLRLKEEFCSPGDPHNHPQRMKRIDLGTPETHYLLKMQPGHAKMQRNQCVKMFENHRDREGVVPGFQGMGDAAREAMNDRPRGMRKLSPHHEEPRRAKSSLDYYY